MGSERVHHGVHDLFREGRGVRELSLRACLGPSGCDGEDHLGSATCRGIWICIKLETTSLGATLVRGATFGSQIDPRATQVKLTAPLRY